MTTPDVTRTATPGSAASANSDPVGARHRLLLRGTLSRLEHEFGQLMTRDDLQAHLDESYDRLVRQSPVGIHTPTFVERFARQRLKALTKNRGLSVDHRPTVLFVGRRNDGPSQMAAAMFRDLAGERAIGLSAGLEPADGLLEDAVHALHEVGIDALDEFPKPLTSEIEEAADVIVALDTVDDLAVVGDRHHEAWGITSPVAGGLDAYRSIRHELMGKVDELIDQVAPPTPSLGRAGLDGDIEELSATISRMGREVLDMVRMVAEAIGEGDRAGFDRVVAADARVDASYLVVANRVLEIIALRQPVAGDLRNLLAIGSTALHLERVADCMVDAASVGQAGQLDTELGIPVELVEMVSLVEAMTGDALAAVVDHTTEWVNWIVDTDRRLDTLHRRVFAWLANGGAGAGALGSVEIDRASRAIKRAGEHALDVAEQAVFAETGKLRELAR